MNRIAWVTLTLVFTVIFAQPDIVAAQTENEALYPKPVEPSATRTIGILPWETESTSPFGTSRWGGSDRRRFALSPDGKFLATEDAGGWQLQLWETQTGKNLGKFGKVEDPVAVAFSPDGKTLISCEFGCRDDTRVNLWDVGERKRKENLDAGVNIVPFQVVDFAPNGVHVALSGQNTIRIWDTQTGFELRNFDVAGDSTARYRGSAIQCLCYTPDGKRLAVVTQQRRMMLLDAATGKMVRVVGRIPLGEKPALSEPVAVCIAVSPDGALAAVGTRAGDVRLWDVVASKELPPIPAHKGEVRALRFVKERGELLSLGADNRLLAWSVKSLHLNWKPPSVALDETTLSRLWEDATGTRPMEQYGASQILQSAPEKTVPFFEKRLKPVEPADEEKLRDLVADLASPEFNSRKRAALEFQKAGEAALVALQEASGNRERFRMPSQLRDIRGQVYSELQSKFPTKEHVAHARALQVLAEMRTPEARTLLEKIAGGLSGTFLTTQAAMLVNEWDAAEHEN